MGQSKIILQSPVRSSPVARQVRSFPFVVKFARRPLVVGRAFVVRAFVRSLFLRQFVVCSFVARRWSFVRRSLAVRSSRRSSLHRNANTYTNTAVYIVRSSVALRCIFVTYCGFLLHRDVTVYIAT